MLIILLVELQPSFFQLFCTPAGCLSCTAIKSPLSFYLFSFHILLCLFLNNSKENSMGLVSVLFYCFDFFFNNQYSWLHELVTTDCSFFGMSSEYFSAHSQWHYAIILLVSTVSLGSKVSYKIMSTAGKIEQSEDGFRGTQTLKSHPPGIQKSPLEYLWSVFH